MPDISLSHPAVLLSVLFSQFRMKGMVLCSLGRSPCSCLSLAVAANSCKTLCERNLLSSWLSSFPKMLALITQMSSTFTEGKEGGKEAREESCVYFFVPGVHSPRIAPAIYECVWVHICTGTWRAGWYGRTPLYLSIALDTAGGEKKKNLSALCLWQIPAGGPHRTHLNLYSGCFVWWDQGVLALSQILNLMKGKKLLEKVAVFIKRRRK